MTEILKYSKFFENHHFIPVKIIASKVYNLEGLIIKLKN